MSKDWNTELEYIESIDVTAPGKSFNDDPECFARYCKMQASEAVKDKKLLCAILIRAHADR